MEQILFCEYFVKKFHFKFRACILKVENRKILENHHIKTQKNDISSKKF